MVAKSVSHLRNDSIPTQMPNKRYDVHHGASFRASDSRPLSSGDDLSSLY